MVNIVIVGAGLSGLSCALKLKQQAHANIGSKILVTIVEARERLGGRMYGELGLDLGAAWSWTFHDKALQDVISKFSTSVPVMLQQAKGLALAEMYDGHIVHAGNDMSPSGDGSVRFEGSTVALIDAIKTYLESSTDSFECQFFLDTTVRQVTESDDLTKVAVTVEDKKASSHQEIVSDAIVLAAPPKMIANFIEFIPALPKQKLAAMKSTPTWMENTGIPRLCSYEKAA